ncbi:MAG: two-component system response regulator [Hydrogenophilales bacterium RIFOXYD1_FULL_62_11]|nr:MAG: two-component system response regulator [Hydrogenophilales bacterium RIFOXYD1_FULL_62_11]
MDTFEQVNILLVEDSPLDAELTIRALKDGKLANTVDWVKDGQQALDYLFHEGGYAGRAGNMPQLVLLDLKMPRVSGIEVLRIIKVDPRTRKIPVVIMTSSQEERDIAESYDLGVNSYVVKPVDFTAMTNLARQAGYYWLAINQPPVT